MMELLYPVDRWVFPITQGFGEHPDWYRRFGLKGHNGLDFGCRDGTAVMVCADGMVERVGYEADGYGNFLRVRHEEGVTIYAHLSQTLVTQGDNVTGGQIVARSGWSGFVLDANGQRSPGGAHLHLTFKRYVDCRLRTFERGNGFDGAVDASGYLVEAFAGTGAATQEAEERTVERLAIVLAAPWLYVRGAPRGDGTPMGQLPAGLMVQVVALRAVGEDVWARLSVGGGLWAAVRYAGREMMRVL